MVGGVKKIEYELYPTSEELEKINEFIKSEYNIDNMSELHIVQIAKEFGGVYKITVVQRKHL